MSIQCGICSYHANLSQDYSEWEHNNPQNSTFYPITKNGKPGSELVGFICARCLSRANMMRVFIKSRNAMIRVSKHAIERFLERDPSNDMSEESARVAIIKIFSQSKEIKLKTEYTVERFFNNGQQLVRYFYSNGFIFVVTDEENPLILTVERKWNRKLNKDFWFTDQ